MRIIGGRLLCGGGARRSRAPARAACALCARSVIWQVRWRAAPPCALVVLLLCDADARRIGVNAAGVAGVATPNI